jgi:hypothetical protein
MPITCRVPFGRTITVLMTEPATSPLRTIARATLARAIDALDDPRSAPGIDVALRVDETLEEYAARGLERARYLADQFASDESEAIVTAPRAVLLAAVDVALRDSHSVSVREALIRLRRTVETTEEDR